jgi:hypothetical protein
MTETRDNRKLSHIVQAIIHEREYQDTHKGVEGKNKHEIPGWVLIMKEQLDAAAIAWLDGGIDKALAEILQATAVGVACLQQHGVPDIAFRGALDPEPEPPYAVTLKSKGKHSTTIEYKVRPQPAVIEVKGFEDYTVYTWNGILLIRIKDLDEKMQSKLIKFMRGQTMTTIEGSEDPYGFIFLHDFENFLADGKLFFD